MALPGGRAITVDGENYHWICKSGRARYAETDWGEEIDVHDNVVTIQASSGVVVQHRTNALSVTPREVIELIRSDVERGNFRKRKA